MKLISRNKKLGPSPRWLCVADLHLHHLPDWRLDWCYDFADDLVEYANEERLDVMLMGDVLEVKDKVDSRVANILIYIIMSLETEVYWITGQHDSYKPGQATFYELGSLDHVHVVDEDVTAVTAKDVEAPWVFCVPFARDRARYRAMLEQLPDGAGIFTHVPIGDALKGFGAELPEDVITAADFKRFSWVYSGDIHKHSRHKNFEYIGATSQRDWRDEGVKGCVGIVNEAGKLTRIPVAHPRHRRITKKIDLKKEGDSPEILKVDGLDVDEHTLETLRERPNVVGVEWIPPPVEALVKKAGVDSATEQDPKKLIDEYLATVKIPDGHVPKKELKKYAIDYVLKDIGRA